MCAPRDFFACAAPHQNAASTAGTVGRPRRCSLVKQPTLRRPAWSCSTLRRGGGAFVFRPLRPAAQEGAERRTGARCGSPHRGVPARHASGRLRGGPARPVRRARAHSALHRGILRTPDPHLRAPGCPGAVQRVASRTSARNGRGASPGRPSAGLTKSRPQETAPRSACRWSSGRRPQVEPGLK